MGGLNDGQKAAVKKLIAFLAGPDMFFTLNGPAGVGKTFVITYYMRTIMALAKFNGKAMPRVYLSAPTHKAVSVMADLMEEDSLSVDCGTIQSLLGLYLTASNELKQLADGGRHKLADYSLIVADEGSMVGGYLFETFKKKLMETGFRAPKVIFLGDQLQLDPVKETASPVFNFVKHTLTEQMRQLGDNPISELIGRARVYVETPKPHPQAVAKLNSEGDGVHVVKAANFKEMVLANFDTDEYKDDTHYCKVLAWRNREVDKWNKIIRTHLLGPMAAQIEVGETLVLQSPVLDMDDRMLMHTEQEVKVVALTTDTVEENHFDFGTRRFKVWVVSGQTKDGIFGTFDVLHEDSLEDYNKFTKLLRNAAFKEPRGGWSEYWKFCDKFTQVRPPFACTVHKSQGSSFSNVFVVMTDLAGNPRLADRNRLIYVGLSRAKENIILNTPRMA